MQACLTGAYPHSEELVAAHREHARKRITKDELNRVVGKDLEALVRLQKLEGFSQIVDGQLDWGDLLRPFSKLYGIEKGSLTRWYNNNTFYWAPRVTGKIEWKESVLKGFLSPNANKLIVPGPYTFSLLCETSFYKNRDEIMFDFAKALNSELKHHKIQYIQISEPSLVFSPPDENTLEKSIDAVAEAIKGIKALTSLQTYFGPIEPIYPAVLEYPVDFIGVDFIETDVNALDSGFAKGLACGIVNARTSSIEKPEDIAESVNNIEEKLEPKEILICPNADLDLRPLWVAEKKIAALASASKIIGELA